MGDAFVVVVVEAILHVHVLSTAHTIAHLFHHPPGEAGGSQWAL